MPERAIVPMFRITSSRDMPMPPSEIDSVRAAGSTSSRITASPMSPSSVFVSCSKRSLSSASEAFEISSRRKTSLFE